jgi:flagellar FliL protein
MLEDEKQENRENEEGPEEEVSEEVSEDGEGGEEGGDHAEVRKKNKLKIIIIGLIVLLVAVGGSVFFYLTKRAEKEEAIKASEKQSPQIMYVEFEDMIVNLNSSKKNVHFLKLKMFFEVEGQENKDLVTRYKPKIRDIFQTYLRELRPEDLRGSVGVYRLREELLLRVNKTIYPGYVNDVLFEEILVQ